MIWEKYLFGTGTVDDWRNPFWRVTEKLAITPIWSKYIFDLRIGFKQNNKWVPFYLTLFSPVTQNFQNGIFTFNIYLIGTKYFIFPRFNLVIRFHSDIWFQSGIGWLFDRGEFAIKMVITKWSKDCSGDAIGYNEGGV
jgi:hypothetical protein